MAEPNNKEEYILNSDWEELIDQTDITPLVTMTDENTPEYTVTINQPEGATITVALLSGETKTETFTAKQGTVYTVSISGDNASKLILNTNGGKVLGDMTIEARDYSKDDNPDYCSIIILQEHAEDQVIYCHLTNPDGTEDTTEYRNSLWVQPGSRCDFTLETNFVRKWDLGKLNVETINPVTKNVNYVYATPPVIRDDFDPTICAVTIIQVPHMTIHVWVTAPGETTEVEHTESFNAKIGSTYRITTTMESNWYEGGRVLYPTTGTFSLDCTITGVSPELVIFTVHIIQTAHQTITVNCNGANYTTDFTARKNSIWKATIAPDKDYKAGDITPATSGSLIKDITITATEATPSVITSNNNGNGFRRYTNDGRYENNHAYHTEIDITQAGLYNITYQINVCMGYNPSSSGPYNSYYGYRLYINGNQVYYSGWYAGDQIWYPSYMWQPPENNRCKVRNLWTGNVQLNDGNNTFDLWVEQQDIRNKHCDTNIPWIKVIFNY